MHRTTLLLPAELKLAATARAREAGISFGEFVRRAIETATAQNGGPDAFLSDRAVYRGRTPRDLSTRHDHYLYGER